MKLRVAAAAVLVVASSPVQSGWTGFTNTALVVHPGGLRAFWGGFRSTDSSDPQNETNTAVSVDGGASVKGAKVKAGGRSGTTNGRGRVTLTLKSRRAATAKATRSGYTGAMKRLGLRG